MVTFKVIQTDNRARVGELMTSHGKVSTPVFLPVGTQASVKALDSLDLMNLNSEMILANTYHLYLRPGSKTMAKLGGLHRFMNWEKPILTDSGGFQVFSLGFGIEHEVGKIVSLYGENLIKGELMESTKNTSEVIVRTKLCKIDEEGPTFQSHLDGTVHFFSPEISVKTQIELGADFIVALDECTSPLHDYDYTKTSMERSHRWEKRSLEHLNKLSVSDNQSPTTNNQPPKTSSDPGMFGVIQGGPFEDLRVNSAKFVSQNNFFGVGIGGALVSKEKMHQILDWIHPHMDPLKPRHLLGVGTIDDIFNGVERGVDIFDCIYPTRIARAGLMLYKLRAGNDENTVNIRKVYNKEKFYYDVTKAVFSDDDNPVDADCSCYTCQHYSRAYVHHLFRSHELLSYRLGTIHNLHFMLRLMENIRIAILEKRFDKLRQEWLI